MHIEQEKNVTFRAYSTMTKAIGFVHSERKRQRTQKRSHTITLLLMSVKVRAHLVFRFYTNYGQQWLLWKC